MPTLEERVSALEAQTPRRSYTSMWSGEEIDRRLLNAAGRNLLDNSWWVRKEAIVNQRGQTVYTTNGYWIDRYILWYTGATAKIEDGGLLISAPSLEATANSHKFDVGRILPGTYTLSALYQYDTLCSGRRLNFFIPSYGDVLNHPDVQDRLVTATFTVPNQVMGDISWVAIYGGGKGLLQAAKLELGPTQTLAHKDANGNWVLNDPPPDYGLELLKCQRYQVIETRAMNGIMGRTEADDKNMTLFVPVPVCMRANPLVTIPKLTVAGNGKAKSYLNISKSGNAMPAGINLLTTVTESAGIGAFQTIFCYMPEGYTIDANL